MRYGPYNQHVDLTYNLNTKFGLRAIDRVGAAVLTRSRHWRRGDITSSSRVPLPVGIWLQPKSCAQYKFLLSV